MSHFDLIHSINTLTVDCLKLQVSIDEARALYPSDGLWQLQLDRKQNQLNEHWNWIETVSVVVPTLN